MKTHITFWRYCLESFSASKMRHILTKIVLSGSGFHNFRIFLGNTRSTYRAAEPCQSTCLLLPLLYFLIIWITVKYSITRVLCFQCLLFLEFRGVLSGYIICRKNWSNFLRLAEICFWSGLGLTDITYLCVFFSHVYHFGFHLTFCQLDRRPKSSKSLAEIIIPAKRSFRVFSIYRFHKYLIKGYFSGD